MRNLQLPFFSLVVGVATLWLACDSTAVAPQRVPPPRISNQSEVVPLDGAKIFLSYCAPCHGVSGKGNGPVAPALKAKVPQLNALSHRNHGQFPIDSVRHIIAGDETNAAHGSHEMPIWGPIFHQIDNDQDLGFVRLQNVTEYLKSIQQK
jgi:mono/diheme cytochrome c family protein